MKLTNKIALLGLSLLLGAGISEAFKKDNSNLEEKLLVNNIDSARVDNGFVKYDSYERGLMIACVISELGEWRYLDNENIRQKAIAMSYVILRRAEQRFFGESKISSNILMPNQFCRITQRFNSFLLGRPEVHTSLSKLNKGYFESMKKEFKTNKSDYMKNVLHLMPSDTTTGTDAENFDRVFTTVKETVDSVLNGNERDNSNGAVYFGYVGDIFASKYHQPKNLVAVFGKLGPYKNVEELLIDPKIKNAGYRMNLYHQRGVDAIFFFK